jgi:hypothetical protein
MPQTLKARDLSDLINTLIGEAGAEGPAGMNAVAHVIWNRARQSGLSPADVARAPNQFSGYYAPGPDAVKAQQNQTLRAQAAQVLMDAFGGNSPDPTGGADHFYATNTQRPYWADQFQSKGQIGGHSFFASGRAAPTAQAPAQSPAAAMLPAATNISFKHPDQRNVLPAVTTMLERAGNSINQPVDVTSGYRSPEHNAAVGGAKQSRHMHRDAADVDMSGWTPEQRQRFGATAIREGANALITYDNSPDMLHVDMRPRPDGAGVMYMHNKSQYNMADAPEWMQTLKGNNGIIPPTPDPRPAMGSQPTSGFDIMAAAGNTPGTFTPAQPPQSDFVTMAQTQTSPSISPVQMNLPAPGQNVPFANAAMASAAPKTPSVASMFSSAPAGHSLGTTPAPTAMSGIGGLLSGLVSALSSGGQAAAQAQQQADQNWQENYAKTLGPNPVEIANQLLTPVPTIAAETPTPVPFRQRKPIPTSQDILASVFGRNTSNVMG